jgi:hypothetical protein
MVLTVAVLAGLAVAACHPGPVIGAGPRPSVGGTISGMVTDSGSAPLAGRKVTITEIGTNTRHETTTTAQGGYTIQVPVGTYRIEIELRPGESLARHPDDTRIDNGDLDAGRDFVVTVTATVR